MNDTYCSTHTITDTNTAIKNLLAEAAKFDRATYMTATPIEREYVLEELKHLPVCEIN